VLSAVETTSVSRAAISDPIAVSATTHFVFVPISCLLVASFGGRDPGGARDPTLISQNFLSVLPPGSDPLGRAFAAWPTSTSCPRPQRAAGLEGSIRNLHRYLRSQLPFTWRIVIADKREHRRDAGDRGRAGA
jgi:hypothetical protein